MNVDKMIGIQKLIRDKQDYLEYLEVEAMHLDNEPQANPEAAKKLSDIIKADIHRVAADLIDLKNGIEPRMIEGAFTRMTQKYHFFKLQEIDKKQIVKRTRLIEFANELTAALKGK